MYRSYGRQTEVARLAKFGVHPGMYQRHHILPKEQRIRELPAIQKSGFRVNGGANIMILPSKGNAGGVFKNRAVHSGPHPQYSERIYRQLVKLDEIGVKRGWTQTQYAVAVLKLTAANKKYLEAYGGTRLK